MTKENSYSNDTLSKTNLKIATLKNNKTFYSIYNPQRDIDFFCSNTKIAESGFICIAGIGNGYHLKKLTELFPEKFIICFEINKTSLNYLLENNDFSFIKNKNVILTTLENLDTEIINNYHPALFNNFYFTYIKSWMDFHNKFYNEIEKKINTALAIVSSDYSVQTHFGKIWMKNILENLNLLCKNDFQNEIKLETDKPAAIIAAGPSLDFTINQLKKIQNDIFVIATDTAYPSLLKNGITPQVVVSIDAQIFSREHFIGISKNELKDTIFLFDFCSNSSITKKIDIRNILFFSSGHPLVNYIENITNNFFLHLSTGGGTVTSCACDFALKCGFKDIILFGSDFSFYKNKPYSKTIYLEKQFIKQSNKFTNLEHQYTKLMFRTPIIKNEQEILTTELLEKYKIFQNEMIKNNDATFYNSIKECNSLNLPIFNIDNIKKNNIKILFNTSSFDKKIFNDLYTEISKIKEFNRSVIIYAILPLLAWGKNKKIDFFSIINIAKKLIHNYTI